MFVVIGSNLIQNTNKNNDIINIKSICEIKKIKTNDNILFIFDSNINDNGLIEEDIVLDELFITIDFRCVISNVRSNALEKTSSYYNIPLIYLK